MQDSYPNEDIGAIHKSFRTRLFQNGITRQGEREREKKEIGTYTNIKQTI